MFNDKHRKYPFIVIISWVTFSLLDGVFLWLRNSPVSLYCFLLQLLCSHHYSTPLHAFVLSSLQAAASEMKSFQMTSRVCTAVMSLLFRVTDFGTALLQLAKKSRSEPAFSVPRKPLRRIRIVWISNSAQCCRLHCHKSLATLSMGNSWGNK